MTLTKNEAADILRAWAATRQENGLKLPAMPQRPNNPALGIIALETGIPRHRYAREGQFLRKVLAGLIEHYGLEVEWDGERFKTEAVHLHLARNLAIDHYARECHETAVWFDPVRQMLERLFAVLIKRAGGDTAAPAALALSAFREDVMRNAVRGGEGFVPYLETCLALVEDEEKRTALPEEFAPRMRLLLARAGLSRSQAASMIGVNQGTFNSWCSGAKSPDRSLWPCIKQLEIKLGVATGTLSDTIRAGRITAKGRFRAELFPEHLRSPEMASLRSEIGRQMPSDFFERSIGEQMQLLAAKAERIEEEGHKQRAWYDIRHNSYALREYPPELGKEVDALFRFKAGGEPLRNLNGETIFPHKCWKKPATIETMHKRLLSFFGYLVDHAPPPLRITPDHASLIHLLNMDAVAGFLRFKSDRQTPFWEAPRLTRTDLDLVTFAAALVSEADGFIRHCPMFLHQILPLRPHYHLSIPTDGDPKRDLVDFGFICARAFEDLKRLEKSYRGKSSNSTKHRARMDALLSLDRPLSVVYERIDQLESELARMRPETLSYWKAVRAIAMLHFFAQAPFRADTAVDLDYRIDNTGHLRQVDGVWRLVVPVHMFKNADASRFADGRDFEVALDDVRGAYAAIERYVKVGRGKLLKGVVSDALFVSTPKNPRYDEQRLANLMYQISARLFGSAAEDANRLAGFKPFSTHGFRDIVATAVLKSTGSYELAADAILDAPSTVQRAYATWRPSDRVKLLKEALHEARTELPHEKSKSPKKPSNEEP